MPGSGEGIDNISRIARRSTQLLHCPRKMTVAQIAVAAGLVRAFGPAIATGGCARLQGARFRRRSGGSRRTLRLSRWRTRQHRRSRAWTAVRPRAALADASRGDQMRVVTVSSQAGTVKLSDDRLLFERRYAFGSGFTRPNYDVDLTDQRLLMVKDESDSGRLNIVLNWGEEPKRLVRSTNHPHCRIARESIISSDHRSVVVPEPSRKSRPHPPLDQPAS